MDSDTQSTAAHFAERPNSEIDSPAQHIQHAQPSAETTEESPQNRVVPDSPSEHTPSKEDLPAQSPSHALDFDHLEHDEESGASLWDTDAPVTGQDETSMSNNEEHAPDVTDTAPADHASKHLSTMSFARTVSHEVSFNDDEDAEWNLQRSETNPFSFMPENERTNSFPIVPQMENSSAEQYAHPLPTNQNGDVLQDLGTEGAHFDDTALEPYTEQLEDAQLNKHDEDDGLYQNTVGGDIVGMEEDAPNTRYEEGLPLIPQHDTLETTTDLANPGSGSNDLFSQDETGDAGDDFFTQIQDHSQPLSDNSMAHTLQRKSTTMVIEQNVDLEPLSPVEDAQSSEPDIPNASVNGDSVHSPEGGAKIAPGTEDIDAKWAAAFDGDDDDGFLLDTTTENKELDPADIFGSDDEGFLDDEEEPTTVAPSQTQTPQPNLNGPYAPKSAQQQPYSPQNSYAPGPPVAQVPATQQQSPLYGSNAATLGMGYGAPPPKPDIPKAQSFASKPKGGYQSPYDLPMEVVKPKKRATSLKISL
ncbi:hypothetical protein ONZ43_g3041 [Nemania bipapillata]|uniref:Uncharacterized protein n=1 Tax=Nemania bipapillata TaxID=110536 RepID=A0ACC2IYA7_9PEZI|nr:hypothetical protein ONZ43_g3041 [Nemania bipapillata]